MKRIRRVVKVLCPDCLGTGFEYVKGGRKACSTCNGNGEVERIVNEIVHDDEDEKARTP